MKVKAYLLSHGITCEQFTEESGVSYNTFIHWYNSENKRKVFDLVVDGIKSRRKKDSLGELNKTIEYKSINVESNNYGVY